MKILNLITILTIMLSTNCFAQQNVDCNILKHCKLTNTDIINSSVEIIIDGNNHIEYFENRKYFIKSKLEWVNVCEYNATMIDITLPNFPFKTGEKMNVKIEKIKDGMVFFKLKVRDINTEAAYKIIE